MSIATAKSIKVFAVKEDVYAVKAELLVVKWMLGFVLAGILALLVKTFF